MLLAAERGSPELSPPLLAQLHVRTRTVSPGGGEPGQTRVWDVEIRTNAALYLPQISELLNRVPRQMLLLLKTNDLLRGIETTLQTRASSSSFINMSRCCIRALARHKKSKAQSSRRRLQIKLAESLSLGKLTLYELFLWVKSFMSLEVTPISVILFVFVMDRISRRSQGEEIVQFGDLKIFPCSLQMM
ncbi:unnamed protein product [Pleuronectes platessa]|uniref:Uncharacterized protein n=1 Tax=Pleuronectes platessa TaxID=8262 RepID=A0A9N7UIN1_PLEPL|nr:unnamed protein product [Pleuronectes platessa]